VFAPRFTAIDLVNLGFAQIYLSLMIDGIGSQPFSAQTLPPIQPPHISAREMTIAASRKIYTKPRSEVEEIVASLHAPKESQKPPTKKNHDNKKQPAKNAPAAKSPDELRAILSDMTKSKPDNSSEKKLSQSNQKKPDKNKNQGKQKPAEKPDPKADLKNALASVLQNSASQSQAEDNNQQAAPQSKKDTDHKKSAPQNNTQKNEHVPKKTGDSTHSQDKSTTPDQDSLDQKYIKKMLKDEPAQRSPLG